MIATLRWRLLAVPACLVRHARGLTLRLPPDDHLLAEVLARLRALPTCPDPAEPGPDQHRNPRPEATLGPQRCPTPGPHSPTNINSIPGKIS